MAKYPRSLILFDDALFHVTWKCHNDAFHLQSEYAKQTYYDLLLKYKDKYGMRFFSYCFMDNHPHLTGQCRTQKEASDFFRVVNGCFARRINRFLGRKGQMVMDRFKSPQIQSDESLREVMIYTDLNPFRTRKRIHPQNFKWSSFHHYAYGQEDALISEPEFYTNLAATPEERQKLYCKMIEDIVLDDWHRPKDKKSLLFKKKRRFSLFIGDPNWVKEKFLQIRALRKTQLKPPQHSSPDFTLVLQ